MKQNIARTSVLVTCILLVGYIIAFFREVLIAKYFGVSADVDAYTAAITIPINLFSIITLSIQSIIVPIYSKILYNKSKEDAAIYVNSLVNILFIGTTLLILFFELLAGPITYLCTPGLKGETHDLTVTLLRICLPTILFSLLNYVYTGVLNVHKNFIVPAVSLWLLNLSVIISILWLHNKFGISAACFGQVVGSLLQFIILFKNGNKIVKYRLVIAWKNPAIKETYVTTLPVVWSTCITEVNAIVNRIVASMLFVGAIGAINYSSKINSVFLAFFTSAIATVVYPMYAEASAKQDISLLNKRVNLTMSAYVLFLLPLTAALLCLKTEIIEVAFARGAFDSNAVEMTQQLLGFLAFGLFFLSVRETITKVYYSLQDTKTPAKNATLGLVLNIILSIILPYVMGVNGLALASSISAAFIAIRLIVHLVKHYYEITLSNFWQNLLKCIVPTIILSIFFILLRNTINDSALLVLIVSTIVGIPLYCFLVYIFKVPIFDTLFRMLINRKK